MIREFLREIISWLGYLQRGSVLLQIALFVAVVLVEKDISIAVLPSSLPNEAGCAPVVLLIVSILSMALAFQEAFSAISQPHGLHGGS